MGNVGVQICWLLGCVAAIWLATHFPKENRARATYLAVVVLANWLAVQMTYTDYGPQYGLGYLGLHFTTPTVWAMFDFLLGLYVAARFNKTWLDWSILTLVCVQELSHDAYKYGMVSAEAYLRCLDMALGVILLLFVFGGWRGETDGIRDNIGRSGFSRRALSPIALRKRG